MAALFVPLLGRVLMRRGAVSGFESREMLGYPLLFFITFQIATLFNSARDALDAVWKLVTGA